MNKNNTNYLKQQYNIMFNNYKLIINFSTFISVSDVAFEDSSNYVLNKDLFEVARVNFTLSCITSINSRNLLFKFIQLKYTNSSQCIDITSISQTGNFKIVFNTF